MRDLEPVLHRFETIFVVCESQRLTFNPLAKTHACPKSCAANIEVPSHRVGCAALTLCGLRCPHTM